MRRRSRQNLITVGIGLTSKIHNPNGCREFYYLFSLSFIMNRDSLKAQLVRFKDETTAPSTVTASGNAIGTERHDCGRLQIGDVTREVECMSNDPKTLTALALTRTDHHDAF